MKLTKMIMEKKIIVLIVLSSIIVFGTVGFFGYVYHDTNKWTNRVYPGVTINDIDVSGKTLAETKELITQKYGNAILKKNLNIKTPDKAYSLDYSKLNARYNIDEVAKKAYDYGKSGNILNKYKTINNPKDTKLELKFVYDPKPIKELIATIKKECEKNAVDGKFSLVNGKFQVVPDTSGMKLLDTKLENDLLSKINGDVNSPNIAIDAPFETTAANITKEKLQTIDTKISGFNTDYSGSSNARVTNIGMATKSINNKLIMPGQSFSFNEIVGQRTAERGYQKAPVIVGTKVDEDYGGGICQVSTTLYNAVIRSGIEATERHPHTLPSHYMGPAMDATVDWGNLDYKFTNTLSFPVYIQGFVENNNIYFNVYSNSSLLSKTYNLVNEVYARIEPGVKYKDDPTLPEGQNPVEQYSSVGIKAKAYKDTYENGKLIEHKQVADDFYQPVDEVILRGTKKS